MQTTQREMLQGMLEMAQEGITWSVEHNEPVEEWQLSNVATIRAQIDALGGNGAVINVEDGSGLGQRLALTARREAGSVAKNQYGTFTVHYATAKQTGYLGFLLDTKDLTRLTSGPLPVDIPLLRQQVRELKVNKKAASDIIDRLLDCPDLPKSAQRNVQVIPATERQVAYLLKLSAERTPHVAPAAVQAWADKAGKQAVSDKIDDLLKLPKVQAPVVERKPIEAGVYVESDGRVFRVYLGQQSGKMLAALATTYVDENGETKGKFDYCGQADRFVTATARKMTVEEAGAWGKATGTCIVCARRLDVPESVDRGIGPVCFARMQG